MKRNKNGFTLVELLAVIVILAVIILIATNNVGEAMTKARKNALAIEGNSAVKGAKEAYQIAILEGDITTGAACFSLSYLYNKGYFDKGSGTGEGNDNYTGSVLVQPDAGKATYTYKFWLSNGSYVFNGVSYGSNGTSATEGTTASPNCGGNFQTSGTSKLFSN